MNLNILLFTLFIVLSTSLHLQTTRNIYDPQKYYESLQTTQDKLKSDLFNIQSMFETMDEQIKNAANDPNQQLRLYQQGIADQRDSLYQIQQYLTIPWNQRSCQCFNFTQDLRRNFTLELNKVQQSLSKIENQAKSCTDCGMAQEIQYQIQIQKAYINTMRDTINSKCCIVYQILYVDNLTANNWLNGGWTPQEYQNWMGEQVNNTIKNSSNQTIVRTCPLLTPYVSSNLTHCGQCPDQDTFFNIRTRQCQQCSSGKIFNYDKHRCDYNVICPPGSQFNENTIECEKVYPPFNASQCPPEAPVWNPQLLGCFKCNTSTPYYDVNLGICTNCPANTTYSPSTNECVNKNCQSDQVYNTWTQQCEAKKVSSNQDSTSQCPSNRPYWDKTSLSCSRCPTNLPYYNSTSKNCQVCPVNSTYDPTRGKCNFQCPSGQTLNPITLVCQNVTIVQPSDSQTSVCPPDRPIWDPVTKSCSQCASSQPYWNANTGSCQKCPVGQILNATTNKCQSQVQQVTCSPGTEFNPATGNCDKVSGTIAFCPPEKPYYNPQIMACSECPTNKPYFNSQTNQCQKNPIQPPKITCPTNYTYDPQTQLCKLQVTDGTLSQCPPSTPLWDSSKGTCVACPSGSAWNSTAKKCAPCANPAQCGQTSVTAQNKTCPYNYQWSSVTLSCEKCLMHQKFNNYTKICQNFCKPGEVYDSTQQICSGTISNCPLGLIFNPNKMLCVCPQGASYRYNPDLDQCSKYCADNEAYNYLTQQCDQIS